MATNWTRREVLRLSGVLVASGLLAGCAPTPPPTEEPTPTDVGEEPVSGPETAGEANVTIARLRDLLEDPKSRFEPDDLTEEQAAQFEADNPGVTIQLLGWVEQAQLFSMVAAGDPPDLVFVQPPFVPQALARNLLYDLTPYFEASDVLDPDDLAPANDYYRAENPLEIGSGWIYGMCRDWSPDFTVFAYTQLFEDAGLEVPDDTAALTYQEVYELASQLAVIAGDRSTTFGFGYETTWMDRIWMNVLAEMGLRLYADGYTRISLTESEQARAVVEYFYDMAAERLTASPINPSPSGWAGGDFATGICALAQYGFWFGAMAESEITAGGVVMLPGPTWSGVRRNPSVNVTGMTMSATTVDPDAAWQVFEWYNGLEPAVARAESGWGVPALQSLYDLIPAGTEYEQQKRRVLQGEIALNTPPLQFDPYVGRIAVNAWLASLERALREAITFDEMLAHVEEAINAALREGVERLQ
jgi:multiple sugar transport system substrate-binding protein